ncbi:glycosyltransferase [Fluviispira sanaruensis]|uniref:Glycosyltransferase family 4 protein n=1 Tax=Fluviispira sanaruensis TaxID=2493639 RepID=A0A4V0P2E2_FLUSA|nr:glycosyltransferase [Fluviispira sanaruensis]BBH52917.1 glycosyltransferase family 4 protein [Fluviispira sanaruensis]
MDKENFINQTKHLKVAVVHDWMFSRRGGEKVLEQILNLFPNADLYYLFGNPKEVLKLEHTHQFKVSFLARIPFIKKFYKTLLPFFPIAIESFDLSNYNLIISSSSCVAKGIVPPPLGLHIAYIHSPMRYAWDQEHRYFIKSPSIIRPIEILRRILLNRLRIWDITSSIRIDKLITNSHFVARRCSLFYGKNSTVIYPPIHTKFFQKNAKISCASIQKRKVLLFGAWTPYKKMYETLEFLIHNGVQVIAAGHGEEIIKARKKFKKNVEFFLNPSDEEVPIIFSKAHALLFPAIEDFGIVPLEATSSGLWVVAPNQGGTKETIIHELTGFTFNENSNECMLNAVLKALERDLSENDLKNMKKQVEKFSIENFQKNFSHEVIATLKNENLL